jgi:hypothetical protein
LRDGPITEVAVVGLPERLLHVVEPLAMDLEEPGSELVIEEAVFRVLPRSPSSHK